MVDMLQQRIQTIALHKICAYSNLPKNKIANKLAKAERHNLHTLSILPHKHVHSTPYYLQKIF